MTNTQRLSLFREALSGVQRLKVAAPGLTVLDSISEQLRYLIKVVEGHEPGDRLGEIVLGVQAAREIDGWDDAAAELLHRSSAEADAMRTEQALSGVQVSRP